MKIAIYARVSTGKQDNENQLAELRKFARKQGTIAAEYVDVVTGSGKNGLPFPYVGSGNGNIQARGGRERA
jgi:DNA invertase Pin-like site-specific DNA recombinase